MQTPPLPTTSSQALTLARTASSHARALAGVALGWLALHSASSWAHDGHGLPNGSHWHASDTLGLLLGAAAVVAVWLWKGRP